MLIIENIKICTNIAALLSTVHGFAIYYGESISIDLKTFYMIPYDLPCAYSVNHAIFDSVQLFDCIDYIIQHAIFNCILTYLIKKKMPIEPNRNRHSNTSYLKNPKKNRIIFKCLLNWRYFTDRFFSLLLILRSYVFILLTPTIDCGNRWDSVIFIFVRFLHLLRQKQKRTLHTDEKKKKYYVCVRFVCAECATRKCIAPAKTFRELFDNVHFTNFVSVE